MPTVLEVTKQAFEALDFTEENARYAEIQAERAGLLEAQDKIRARTAEIDEALQDIRNLKAEDAAKAADRLLANGDVNEISKAVSTEQDLRDEWASLRATLGELNRREQDLYPKEQDLQNRCRREAAKAAAPIVDAILSHAVDAGKQLVNAYAALWAVAHTTGGRCKGKDEIADVIDALKGLFEATDSFPAAVIPDDVRTALLPLETKGPVARMRVPSTVNGSPNIRTWSEVGGKLREVRLMSMHAAQARMAASTH